MGLRLKNFMSRFEESWLCGICVEIWMDGCGCVVL